VPRGRAENEARGAGFSRGDSRSGRINHGNGRICGVREAVRHGKARMRPQRWIAGQGLKNSEEWEFPARRRGPWKAPDRMADANATHGAALCERRGISRAAGLPPEKSSGGHRRAATAGHFPLSSAPVPGLWCGRTKTADSSRSRRPLLQTAVRRCLIQLPKVGIRQRSHPRRVWHPCA
jgi:hypothetical protein